MRRAGGWVLGVVVVAAMAVGGWVAFRPILNRETLWIQVVRGNRDPSSDALISGMGFALAEAGHRGGPCRVEILEAKDYPGWNVQALIGDMVLIEAFSGPANLREAGHFPTSLRVLMNPEELGAAASRWARASESMRTVLLCDEKTPQSRTIARSTEKGGPPHVTTFDTAQDADPGLAKANREALIDKVLAEKPDLVFYAGEASPYGTGFDLFEVLRRKGYSGRIAMADADPEVSFLAVPAKVVDGTLLISPIGPPSKEFAAAYEPATGRFAGPHAWPGYLTMKAILRTLEHATSKDEAQIDAAFRKARTTPRPAALYEYKAGKFDFVRDLR